MKHVIGEQRTDDKAFVDLLNRSAIRAMRKDTHASSMLIALAEAIRVKLVNEGATFEDIRLAVKNAAIAPRDPEPLAPLPTEDTPAPTLFARARQLRRKLPWSSDR